MSQRNRWYRSPVLVSAIALGVLLAIALPSLAKLTGSTFEGNDGNLVVNTAGGTDWVTAPNRVRGDDLPSGQSDNSFGQGTKEDDSNVTVVTGSIPPNKSDLTRFYVASEFASNSNFLYLAWERSNVLGSANMDFEINKLAQPNLTTTGAKTLNRSPGDMLVTFDFTNGGGNPVLGLLRWMTATNGSAADCFSAQTVPCWGAPTAQDLLDGVNDNRVNLSAAGFAEGAVNTGTVTDPIPDPDESLPGLTFGEAAINLSAAGVFPPGTCTGFGSAFLKSRASASFPAAVKDFVAPQPVNISNCGTIIVKKVTVPSPDPTDTTFSYTAGGGLSPTTFGLKNGGMRTYSDVVAGSGYSVAETVPANWVLTSATCDDGSPVTNISVSAGETVTCTFTNTLQLGAIKIHKTSSKTGNGLGGATFSITSGGNAITGSPFTTNSNGNICVDSLSFGDYVVTETGAPTGFAIDDATGHTVSVNNSAKCSDSPYVGETESFTDTPLADIQVRFRDGGSGETILDQPLSCDNVTGTASTSDTANWDDTRTVSGIKIDGNTVTVTCTIVIDP